MAPVVQGLGNKSYPLDTAGLDSELITRDTQSSLVPVAPRGKTSKVRNPFAIAALSLLICFAHFAVFAQATNLKAPHRRDQILIMPKRGAKFMELVELHGRGKSSVLKEFPGIGGLQVVRLAAEESVAEAIARYQKSGLVEFAEPDYEIQAAATLPNDPFFADGTLWALNNTGQNGGTPDADIDAPEAWDIRTSASNIVVAVLDTGIRASHEDLAANMWTSPSDGGHGWNAFATNTSSGDDQGHGTLVAGVIGAVGNNGKGVAGVAWQVQLMAGKCLDGSGNGTDSTLISCIDYARTNGAKIINASLDSPGYSAAVSNAIVACRDAGIIFVSSAGNNGANIDVTARYPSCYDIDNIVSVAASTRTDDLWSSSNYGLTNVDLAAPGASMYSTFFPADNSYIGGSFLNGTSLAAPYVAGTLALMLAKFPDETYQQIIARLLAATDPLPSLTGKCVTGGRLNVRKALSPDIQLTMTGALPFRFSVAAGPNRQCIVESSTNLLNWTSIATNTTSTNGTFLFTNNVTVPPQFFRAFAAP